MDVINGREVVYEWSHRAWHPVTLLLSNSATKLIFFHQYRGHTVPGTP